MKVLVGPNTFGLERCLSELPGIYPEIELAFCSDREKLAEVIADADVLLGWVTPAVFQAAKKLKWIQSPSSGVNMYTAIPALVESDVLLTSARGTHGSCLADHTFAMILAFSRHIREFVLHQQKHHWAAAELRPQMLELTGRTIGIVGLGVIGRTIAKRANGFDMRILAVDAYPVEKPDYVERLANLDGLDQMLTESDYVVVTVPYTEETDGMIGAAQIGRMKPGAILLGISRGGIIDEKALVAALREKRIAGAGLDVFDREPLPADSELWDLDNLLITPHIAGGSQYECDHILEIFYDNIGRFIRGEFPLRNQVDKRRGF